MTLDVDKLREIMVARAFSIAGLSRASGVSKGTISLWFTRNKQPRWDTLGKVLRVLDVPMGAIVVKG